MDPRKKALDDIIDAKQIRIVFQPIISLRDGSILGHEALSRITKQSVIKNPEMLFTYAGEYNRLWELELLCRTKALEAAYQFMIPPYSKKLFINVNPNTIHDENFKKGFTMDFLRQYQITPQNIIFEITERNIITDMDGFRSTISHYKSQNYRIAIDDAGAGYSGLNLISDVNPNYIKLDMNLIRGIDTDSLKFAIVKGMVELSKGSNIFLIAEGIETSEELETLIGLGVQYGQGYFIQKPDAEIRDIASSILQAIKECNCKQGLTFQGMSPNNYIKNLCTFTATASPTERVKTVYDIFKQNPECFGLCVIKEGIPVGIVTQGDLALKLSGHYGFTLNQNKSISEIMDRSFLAVDHHTPISTVSTLAMARPNDKLYDFIVVTENDQYIGTVTIKDLLQKTTEIEVSVAKHQNPLTGLPGNLLIEQQLTQCVTHGTKYSVAYLDINNFKAYNDVYGFENGDLVIRLVADTLRENITGGTFIGHIGGDDFVIILHDHVNEGYFVDMVKQFEYRALNFYSPSDIQKGYIITANRQGEMEKFPLMKLTCVVVNNQIDDFENVIELTEKLARLKKIAKQKMR
ncbi:GGDEF domain-containing protein [Rubeoparvulum massiliense]|uniref:GGDEF domain-containing protein n=1 Tax=Rubeoparvulum massiliense TaxID=1631346 RepID=UPI0009758917|nr:GGDEF domain-containing protein [Rubeoparvulum massiliense]